MADEIDTRQAIAAAKEAFNTFSQSSKEYRMDCLHASTQCRRSS
jgi:aldehyde dehydrogenase (NAD+)